MPREQPIVARDFIGLGMMGDSSERIEAEGRHPSLADSGPSTFTVSKDCGLPWKAEMTCLGGPSTASMNNGAIHNGIPVAGIRHSIWNKATAFQHLLPPRGAQFGNFGEQSTVNIPEKSYSNIVHSEQGNFKGTLPDNAHSFSMPNPTMQQASFSGAGQKRVSIAETTDKQDCAPLTIFYGGSVNVFNDVTAEKARAIMFFAGGGNMRRSMIDFLGSTSMLKANVTDSTGKIEGGNVACCKVEGCHAATSQAGHANASIQLDLGHPSVPAPPTPGQPAVSKALPQARKASLARFLEKRRERVQSKAPYCIKQVDSSSPEERFSSSNDIASYRPWSNADDKLKMTMPGWMERITEYTTSDMKQDSNIVLAQP